MFNFFKHKTDKQPSKKITTATENAETIIITISGMHCMSCSLNIDGALEDTAGVLSATTSYPKSQTVVQYNAEQLQPAQLKQVITELGYTVVE